METLKTLIGNYIQITVSIAFICLITGWFIGYWGGRMADKKLIEKLQRWILEREAEIYRNINQKGNKNN